MAEITAAMVKELREKTGAGMMDCKKALEEAGGDINRAIDILREKGLAAAAKKAARVAAEGLIAAHVSGDGKVGALVEVNCETDFVARNEEFRTFALTLARQVAEKAPADLEALLKQPYAGGDGVTVEEFVKGLVAKIGENQSVRRFVRMAVDGEGVVHHYIHGGTDAGRVGVLVQVAGSSAPAVHELAHELCLQIASMRPQYLRREEVPEEVLEHERQVQRQKALNEGKPEKIVDRIVQGQIEKFFRENVLLEQAWVKDDKKKIADLVREYSQKVGAELQVVRFARFEVGEGIEKKADDFAEEVKRMAGQ
ncbi:MAG: translation elongation factor Ts [Firmicutes bacterium]|nr:translation elongation factor Ts [Bacillota bacterium]